MRKSFLAAAASLGAILLASAPASAAITFNLDNVNFNGGGSLTGTFTTSNDLSTLLGFSISTTANSGGAGNFPGATYTLANAASVIWSPILGLSASFVSPISQIGLVFAAPLTTNGTKLALSNETVIKWNGGGVRFARSGTVSAVAGAVPEPTTWAMMVVGLGLVGASMRRRKVAISFA